MSPLTELVHKHRDLITQSFTHPLTNELCLGTLPDRTLFVYLTQDLKFFQRGMNVFGRTLALCDDADAAIVLAKQIGFIANDENDYFTECLRQIEPAAKTVPHMVRTNLVLPKVQQYLNLLDHLALRSESYVELITFMYVMEYVYLGWANHNLDAGVVQPLLAYKHREWVDLHSGPKFAPWVQFLQHEVERVTAYALAAQLQVFEETFVKALTLEIDFFEECYRYSE